MKKNNAVSVIIPGFTLGAVSAGLKANNALDLCLILSDRPCTAAGVFTRNRVVGEPVRLDRLHLRYATHRAIIVNSKIANVCTGPEGYANAKAMAAGVARQVGCNRREVFVASTGIIGRQLPMEKVRPGIANVFPKCQANGWEEASRAIMTTDTYPKLRTREFTLGGKKVKMAAIAKGSGMIQPNMATMLSFICTDAAIPKDLLQGMLRRVADQSFNCVTVDGDTSTSDSMIVLANGLAKNPSVKAGSKDATVFEENLLSIATELAREIARDGEGAQHLITVRVQGGRSFKTARKIAMTVANSPLVKTAIYGRDANWGRIIAAAGRAGVPFSPSKLCLRFNDFLIFKNGHPVDFDEAALTKTLSNPEVLIDLSVGKGTGEVTVWTCDFTEDYIRINADYRS